MREKKTNELEAVLGKTHPDGFAEYCMENRESMAGEHATFQVYVKDLMREKGITQQEAFIKADVPEHYGYKLLSGEKHTSQRDVILRICYAAGFTLRETQRALRKYEMPELYAKFPRDALLMILFNERPGSIIDVNETLQKHGMKPLRTSGLQE